MLSFYFMFTPCLLHNHDGLNQKRQYSFPLWDRYTNHYAYMLCLWYWHHPFNNSLIPPLIRNIISPLFGGSNYYPRPLTCSYDSGHSCNVCLSRHLLDKSTLYAMIWLLFFTLLIMGYFINSTLILSYHNTFPFLFCSYLSEILFWSSTLQYYLSNSLSLGFIHLT